MTLQQQREIAELNISMNGASHAIYDRFRDACHALAGASDLHRDLLTDETGERYKTEEPPA